MLHRLMKVGVMCERKKGWTDDNRTNDGMDRWTRDAMYVWMDEQTRQVVEGQTNRLKK